MKQIAYGVSDRLFLTCKTITIKCFRLPGLKYLILDMMKLCTVVILFPNKTPENSSQRTIVPLTFYSLIIFHTYETKISLKTVARNKEKPRERKWRGVKKD